MIHCHGSVEPLGPGAEHVSMGSGRGGAPSLARQRRERGRSSAAAGDADFDAAALPASVPRRRRIAGKRKL